MDSAKVVGLIAGEGRLPFMIAAGIRREGMKVVCVGLAGSVEQAVDSQKMWQIFAEDGNKIGR